MADDALEGLQGRSETFTVHHLRALQGAGLSTKSQILAQTESQADVEAVRQRVSACGPGLSVSSAVLRALRELAQDSRLSVGGFPDPSPETESAILFTAPHSIYLRRPGHKAHVPELHTSELARNFARACKGAFLTWTRAEEVRNKELFEAEGQPDETNHDPNFTPRSDLRRSPWTRNIRLVREQFGRRPCLHVDLHGCKNPRLDGGSHVVVGLRAMECAGLPGAQALRDELLNVLSVVLKGFNVNVQPQRHLTGAWPDDRCTLTQQSLDPEGGGWTHAVQIELCARLRKLLKHNAEWQILLAQGILIAWVLASREENDRRWGSAREHCLDVLDLWLQRCNRFHECRDAAIAKAKAKSKAGNGQQGSGGAGRKCKEKASSNSDDEPEGGDDRADEEPDTANNEATGTWCPGPSQDAARAFTAKAEDVHRRMLEDLDDY